MISSLHIGTESIFCLTAQKAIKNQSEELLFEYIKGIAIFMVIAISADMALG